MRRQSPPCRPAAHGLGVLGQRPICKLVRRGATPYNSDYYQIMQPAAARQAEVARDYLKRAAGIGELNGHPPGPNGPMVTALKGYNGGQVLVFVMGVRGDVGAREPNL